MAYYGIPTKSIHEQWLGLVQPVGLVVAPAVLTKLELVPNQSTAYIAALQLQLNGLLEKVDGLNGDPVKVVASFQQLATELLDWSEADLLDVEALVAARGPENVPEVVLSEYGETLRPTHGVPKQEGEGLQGLVLDLTQWRDASDTLKPQWGRDFDSPWNPAGNGWDATPQQRFERLLKETEHPIGILFNGTELRLVHAPRGESSGHITLPLEPMAEVAGRPMLGALEMLLGVDRLFGGNPAQRLPALLAASRKNQNEVSTRLAEQVLEALWELLLGFDAAERLAQDSGRNVLGDLPNSEEGQKHLYGGLITVLLRLVFLLYAEDEELMPRDSLYGQHYSVSALADRLRQERFEHQSAMADRRGAWASLLSLFRLVYDGGGADPNYLPARHGELFDPDAYPFLEGRESDSCYDDGILTNLPRLSDDVVEKVLSKLIWLDGERLSYRALDVEQIGSVYEGIMGFTVHQARGPSVGITCQKSTITVVVDVEQLLGQSGSKREKWLDAQAEVALKLPAKVKEGLKQASSQAELCLALGNRLSPHTPNGLASGSLILQPTAERRRSGSHYTPRALTEPIVAEAFRPWLERCHHKPTAEQILALKVCDPAMGSGAFLVAVCRYLAGWLVQAWERDGYPDDFRQEWDKDNYARRLIAQRCLYGVDKNPFAVNLAKLSLWLVTLSKELPFTFVDHALKCGDSLVGYCVRHIQTAMQEVQLGFLNEQNQVFAQMGMARRESFGDDNLNDEGYDRKKLLLQQQIKATEGLRQAGDLMVAAFFAKPKPKERADKQQLYLAMLSGTFNDDGLADSVQEIRDDLASGDRGIRPFHWDLEFPEVFGDGRGGFDVFVGNPPFLGGIKISGLFGESYLSWLQHTCKPADGNTDLCAYFFRRANALMTDQGSAGLIATNTICQGDTRRSSLSYVCNSKGLIYSAEKRVKWPGVAAVIVSSVHFIKNAKNSPTSFFLNGNKVRGITPYLLEGVAVDDPKTLMANQNLCFSGATIVGDGFILGEDEAVHLLGKSNTNGEVIKQFLGGQEMNESPKAAGNRYIINFGTMGLEEASQWSELLEIVRERVKPERDKKESNAIALRQKKYWWRFRSDAPFLREAVSTLKRCMALCRVGKHISISFQLIDQVFGDSLRVFSLQGFAEFGLLQGRIHELWARFLCSSFKDDLRYSQGDCFDNFPFPNALLASTANDPAHEATRQSLEAIGERYHQFRAELMVANNEGLTSTYNRFHDPAESSTELLELRRLHGEMDQAVLAAYGWSDLPQLGPGNTPCGFGLDYLDIEEDAQLPDGLQERIDSGELFFWDAGDALDFQGQLQACGAITGRRKLPWRYRWPDAVRDDVLARLLALNAERYAEEVALGLHSKGGKAAAKASKAGGSAAGGKGRGRPAKTPPPDSGQTVQIGLVL
ncbi:MAG TPA: SAM-dependent methyltransferase [Synechococcales bacterium UBA10510]|nr:SAM-dependent methyltransferase [Synechococcales bacterium UBA10510]